MRRASIIALFVAAWMIGPVARTGETPTPPAPETPATQTVNRPRQEDQAVPRCPAADTLDIDGQPLELQCVHWSADPEGRHSGDHLVHTPPSMGDDYTWPNDNPLEVEP